MFSALNPRSMRPSAAEALHHQRRADHEHDRERHFGDDQQAAEPLTVSADRRLAALAQRFHQVDVQRPQRRRQTEDDRRRDAERQGEGDHGPVQADRRERRKAGRIDRHQDAQARRGKAEPEDRARQGEHHAFGEKLAHQAIRRRADRRAHRHLAQPRIAADQQQVRHVRTRDQQQEADRAHQQPHCRLDAAADLFFDRYGECGELQCGRDTRPAR
jgi:hypothetical protein